MAGITERQVRAEIAALPPELADSGLAAGILVMARQLDTTKNSATSKAMCFKAMQDGLRELRELAPPKETRDAVDDVAAARARRLERLADAADTHSP